MSDTTFLDVINQSLEKCDQDTEDVDEDVLEIVKNAINTAYFIICKNLDLKIDSLTTSYAQTIDLSGKDILDIIKIEHEYLGYIGPSYYKRIGDIIYFITDDIEDDSGDLTITYSKMPQKLVNDDDIIDLKSAYIPALSSYAAYSVRLTMKKYSAAQLLLQEFYMILGNGVGTQLTKKGGK